ncbi:HNH endonuclease [Maribacter sp. CXY002]|uniref:HNH endonuclease n=1 Tax=Maribacter luteocoastalis TaxID=3407671 RepID=UPI003B66DF29
MANTWGISIEVENFVIERDTHCVYCGIDFLIEHTSRKTKPTWEHIVNDIRINTKENIALCCTSCNASKGAKSLKNWLDSPYCRSKGISDKTVAPNVKNALKTTLEIRDYK